MAMETRLRLASFVLIAGVGSSLFLATQAISQDATVATAAPPPPNGTADRYLELREGRQRGLASRLETAGRGADLNAIRALVKANLRQRQYTMQVSGGSPERLQAADVEDVAQFLAVHGYTAKDLAPGNPAALAVVQAASRAVLGGSTLRDMVLLSPIVVIGEITSRTADIQADDAYRSTVQVRVAEVLKGDVQAGATLSFRQQSGPERNGLYLQLSSELPREAKGQYLLFLSDAAYQIRGRAGRPWPSGERLYSTAGTPHVVNRDSVSPIGDSESQGDTLANVRSFAK